jgi:adenylyltransferase/sulfurtransferase
LFRVDKLWHFTYSYDITQSAPSLNLLPESACITCTEYKSLIDKGELHLLLDVRPAHDFQMISLSEFVNIALSIPEEKLPVRETSLKETTDFSATSHK